MKTSGRDMECPFPPCGREWWVDLGRRTVPDHDFHSSEVDMDLDRCPGALTVYQLDGPLRDSAYLTEGDREYVTGWYRDRYLPLVNRQVRREEAESDSFTEQQEAMRRRGPFIGFPVGNRPDYDARADYFPGRPADAVEPGTGEVAGETPPPPFLGAGRKESTQRGQPLGRAEMDSARDQTSYLVTMTIGKIGEAQDVSASIMAMLEMVEGRAAELTAHVTAAESLGRAAVGADGGNNEHANTMMAALSSSGGLIGANTDELSAAVVVVSKKLSQLTGLLETAVDSADMFRTQLG